jgi:DNA-binding transcriptional regulator YhcF (GntR family)
MGRPTSYSDEIISKVVHYIEHYEELGDKIPSIAGLACELGVARETIHAWVKDPEKQEFSNIIKLMLSAQERKLANGGLDSSFNSTISKLILTKHGYSDRQELDHQSTDGTMNIKVQFGADNS